MGPRSHLLFWAYKTAWFAPVWQVYMASSTHLCLFSCKTATLGPDIQVCTCPRLHLWFWAHITACLAQEYKDYMGSSHHLWFCACKTATIAYESLVSICHSPHLWFLYAKQRVVHQHTSLYGYKTSPVILCIQISVISTTITSFYGFQLSSVVLYMKTATLGPDLQVCMGPRNHLWFWALIAACLAQE